MSLSVEDMETSPVGMPGHPTYFLIRGHIPGCTDGSNLAKRAALQLPYHTTILGLLSHTSSVISSDINNIIKADFFWIMAQERERER